MLRRMVSKKQRKLAKQRYVEADTVGADPYLLDDYPHRYVFVAMRPRGISARPMRGVLPTLFHCVELLEARGWEPVAWDVGPGRIHRGVVMRRRML